MEANDREGVAAGAAQDYRDWAQSVLRDRPPSGMAEYLQRWEAFFDHYSTLVEFWERRHAGYHASIASVTRFHVPPGCKVLEIGSATGNLLAATQPSRGLGIDISGQMTRLASAKHPNLEFRRMAAEELDLQGEQFDYIVLSDAIGFFYDIGRVFDRLRAACHPRTRIVIHWHSRLWQPIFALAEKLGLKYPQPLLNWTTVEDIANLLSLANFEAIQKRGHILLPKGPAWLRSLANRFLAHLPGAGLLCLTNWVIARPLGLQAPAAAPSVSVICPCRNEEGNIEQIAQRLPEMGSRTELIFVEGHSKDGTLAECRRVAAAMPEKNIKVLCQTGRGKGDAVRLGFAEAKGDILMILDADISVMPEDLVQFYRALAGGKGEFVNGSRLVYAMDPEAMRFLNILGNKFFALLLSRLINQPIKDTLCGTKVIWRDMYEQLAKGRAYFGEFDPFGDFDLLFGASKLNLKIVEIPIRYRQRVYGSTNISRFRDGWLLLRMSARAAAKLFFVA